MFHIHVLLVALLDTGHMTQPSAGQRESRVAIQETAYHTSAARDLPVQLFNDVVGANASPVFTGKIVVGLRFLNTILINAKIRVSQQRGKRS